MKCMCQTHLHQVGKTSEFRCEDLLYFMVRVGVGVHC